MLVAIVAFLVLLLAAPPALGQPPDDCILSHEAGQLLRNEGKLREARAKLEGCANPSCPVPVQEDCARWREELDAALPTVVATLRADGRLIRDARLSIDGEVVQEELDGRALAVDPGERLFRFEAPDGRLVERRLMILEGVKNRVIEASLKPLVKAPPPAPPSAGPSEVGSGPPAAFWIAGSLGVAGVAAFAIVGGIGVSRENTLRDDCAGSCAEEDVDAVRRLYIAADVVGGVGIASLIVATVIGIVDLVDDDEASAVVHPGAIELYF